MVIKPYQFLAFFVVSMLVHACGGAKFFGESGKSSGKKSEETADEPVDIAGGFGLTCSLSHVAQENYDSFCLAKNEKGEKLTEKEISSLDISVKVADVSIPVTLLAAADPNSFKFPITTSQVEEAVVSARVKNIPPGRESTSEKTSKLKLILVCRDDCYKEGAPPNYAQDLALGAERIGPDDVRLLLSAGSSGFKIWKEKDGDRILNASGMVANGWQKKLKASGVGFDSADFTSANEIAGRACPPNVFLDYDKMTATGRCVYYDNDSTLVAASIMNAWTDHGTGRQIASSYFELQVPMCSNKFMRLPTLYEVSLPTMSSNLPDGDVVGGVILSPVFADELGVPSVNTATGHSITASAYFNVSPGIYYWSWRRPDVHDRARQSGGADIRQTIPNYTIRCVLPSHP